jgi:hypothetical protein
MKTLLAAMAAALLFAGGCDSTVHGNGQFRTETRSVTPFDGVSIGLKIQANVQANAGGYSLTISGDSNVLQYIKTRVNNGILETHLEGIDDYDSVHRVQLAVSTPALFSAVAYNSSDVAVAGLEADSFAATASEGSAIMVAAPASPTEQTFLTVTASGTSAVDASGYPVSGGSVTLSGGSTARVTVNGTITCSVQAGSTLTNLGSGTCGP